MAAPKSNTYRGWYNDAENSTLDVYIGYGGASDPASAATFTSSAATVAGSLTAGTGLVATAGTLTVNDYGAITQGTNKQTTVINSNIAGQITMHAEALAAAAETTFTVTNTLVAINDAIIVNVQSGGTAGEYIAAVTTVASGSFKITLANHSTGSASDAVILNFVVIKANA